MNLLKCINFCLPFHHCHQVVYSELFILEETALVFLADTEMHCTFQEKKEFKQFALLIVVK